MPDIQLLSISYKISAPRALFLIYLGILYLICCTWQRYTPASGCSETIHHTTPGWGWGVVSARTTGTAVSVMCVDECVHVPTLPGRVLCVYVHAHGEPGQGIAMSPLHLTPCKACWVGEESSEVWGSKARKKDFPIVCPTEIIPVA